MNRAFLLAALLALPGCTSLQQAGTASYTIRPVLVDGKPVCCEVAVVNGKQYASLDATVTKTGDDYLVELRERGVEAFAGQQIAAGGVKSVSHSVAKAAAAAAIAPVALPLAGAALVSGTAGAAAAGVAAGVMIEKAGD